MLKKHKLCKVCALIDDNPKLLKDIYQTTHYIKGSKYSLLALMRDYEDQGFNYTNLKNHVKKHQYLSEKDFTNRNLRQIANQAEKQILKKSIESIDVWETVINEGMDQIQSGDTKVRVSDLLKAAKDKSDFHFKKQDQDLKLAEMVFFFASGENKQELTKPYDRRVIEGTAVKHIDPAAEFTGHPEPGEGQSSSVYYPPAWDAAT